MKETATMTSAEQRRGSVVTNVLLGALTVLQAA
jgi:hypothetical protein